MIGKYGREIFELSPSTTRFNFKVVLTSRYSLQNNINDAL